MMAAGAAAWLAGVAGVMGRDMKIEDSYFIPAAPAEVWQALNDPDVLRVSIPGCELLENSEPNRFDAVIKRKIGPVNARFEGTVTISDIVEGESYTISGEGGAGAAGSARGGARVRLAGAEGGTELSYEVEVQIRGKIAQLGSRLINAFAKSTAKSFFDGFSAALAAESGGRDEDAASTRATVG